MLKNKLFWSLLTVSFVLFNFLTTPALAARVVLEDNEKSQECYIQDVLCLPIPVRRTDYIKDELLLLLNKSYPELLYKSLLKEYGLNELSSSAFDSLGLNLVIAGTNGQDPLELESKINSFYDDLEAATNNIYGLEGIIVEGMVQEALADELYPKSLTGAQEALKISRGKGVLIGMIDGFVDIRHPSFQGRISQQSLVGDYSASFANQLHGTSIAGILVSNHPAIGIAPEAKVFSIAAFSKKNKKTFSSTSALIAQAVEIAINKKVDILNLSFAGGSDKLVEKLLKKAMSKGIIVVASCGNNKSTKSRYPAAIKDVIAVTAVDSLKNSYVRANRGDYIDVAAPGVSIVSTAPGSRYELSTGTSFAAANVSGSLALLLAKKKGIDRDLLSYTATDLGKEGRDSSFGDGLINVLQALEEIK